MTPDKTNDIRSRVKTVKFTEITKMVQNKPVIMTLAQFETIIKKETPDNVTGFLSRLTYFGVQQNGKDINIMLTTGVGNPLIKGYTRLTNVTFAIPHGTKIPWISFRALTPLDEKIKTLLKEVLVPTTRLNFGLNNIHTFAWTERQEKLVKDSHYGYLYKNDVHSIHDVKLDVVIPIPGQDNRVLLGTGDSFKFQKLNIKTGKLNPIL